MITTLRCWSTFLTVAILFAFQFPLDEASAQRNRRGHHGGGWDFVAKKYDADKNGSVTAEEYTRGAEGFKSLDHNGDGLLDKSDWETGTHRYGRDGNGPDVGDVAPDFALTEIGDKSKTVTLSDFAGKQPVALIFGSCT